MQSILNNTQSKYNNVIQLFNTFFFSSVVVLLLIVIVFIVFRLINTVLKHVFGKFLNQKLENSKINTNVLKKLIAPSTKINQSCVVYLTLISIFIILIVINMDGKITHINKLVYCKIIQCFLLLYYVFFLLIKISVFFF